MNKLRIGLLLDTHIVPFWVFKLVENINTAPFAQIVVTIEKTGDIPRRPGLFRRLVANRRELAFVTYTKMEKKLHKLENDAFLLKDLSPLLINVPRLSVVPRTTTYSDYVEQEDLERIKTYDLDVLIRLGFRIIRGPILKLPRYGIWSYHHGDNSVNKGMPSGAWEFLEKWHTTGSTLQILTGALDGGHVLYKSHSATNTAWLNENRNKVYWKSTTFIPRMLKRLYDDRENFMANHVATLNAHPPFYSNPLYKTPTNGKIIKTVIRNAYNKVKNTLSSLIISEKWCLMYHFARTGTAPSFDMYKYKRLIPPHDRFWADPHSLCVDGRYFIFFEDVLKNNPKGRISVIEIDENGKCFQPVVALERDYHLSYPFVFLHDGRYFMVPETAENRTIELYESEAFPLNWKKVMNLMTDVVAVDATLLHHDNKWWLFTNMLEIEGASSSDELFLFYADDLFTNKWIPHPLNPIVSDVRAARPAGPIFTFNGNLYRPAQMSAFFYGWGIVLNEIIRLSETEYEEKSRTEIKPLWAKDVKQTHTLSFCEKLTVIDAKLTQTKYFK